MNSPTSRQELRRAIDGAWDAYEAELTDLGKVFDPDFKLTGLAAAHAFIGPAAESAYLAFLAEQSRINAEYGAYTDAPYIAKQLRKLCEIAIHNADALVASAKYNYEQVHNQLQRVRAGEYAKYGIEEPDPHSVQHEADRLANLTAAQARAAIVKEEALVRLAAELAGLEAIRPGVTTDEDVEAEEPEMPRDQRIYQAISTYDGHVNRRGYPNMREFARQSGIRDIKRSEIRRACDARREEAGA